MARRPTGQVLVREGKTATSYSLRITVDGRRIVHPLGRSTDAYPWDRARADRELQHVLADVDRGQYVPPSISTTPKLPEPEHNPTVHEFWSAWKADYRASGREPRSIEAKEWVLARPPGRALRSDARP